MIRRSGIALWMVGLLLFVVGSILPWASAFVGENAGMTSFRPIDDAEVGWMLLPAAVLLLVLMITLTRVEGIAYRLVALAGLCLSGFVTFMVNATLNVQLLGTDEYVIDTGRSVTLIGAYLLIAGCALALVAPTTRSNGLPLRTRMSRHRTQQVSGF